MRTFFVKASLLCFALFSVAAHAQSPFAGLEHMFITPKAYVAGYTPQAPVIDGNINDVQWTKAQWTSLFEDIEGDLKPKPRLATRAKMMWDSTYLYVAAELIEPHVWANIKNHDEIVYWDNDFEIFIDPKNDTHQYYEIEINALNTIFDLLMPRGYRNGSSALFAWNTPGMKTAIGIHGSLNNASDKDSCWTIEFAIPFTAVTMFPHNPVPKDGSFWRINFSRVEWDTEITDGKYIKKKDANGKNLPEHNWVWSPIGIVDMHNPERWGYLSFSRGEVGTQLPKFDLPYTESQRQYLWLVYYKQKQYAGINKKYASTLNELGIKTKINVNGLENTLEMHATPHQFTAIIKSTNTKPISINDEGLVR